MTKITDHAERAKFEKATNAINHYRAEWGGTEYRYGATQKEWELWQAAVAGCKEAHQIELSQVAAKAEAYRKQLAYALEVSNDRRKEADILLAQLRGLQSGKPTQEVSAEWLAQLRTEYLQLASAREQMEMRYNMANDRYQREVLGLNNEGVPIGGVEGGLLHDLKVAQERLAAFKAQAGESVGWQFYQDGQWHNGLNMNRHRELTEAAGIRTRDVYPHPPIKENPNA